MYIYTCICIYVCVCMYINILYYCFTTCFTTQVLVTQPHPLVADAQWRGNIALRVLAGYK